MVFSIEGFKHFKNILHPNIVDNANEYLKNGYYHFPTYHGCGKKIKMEQIKKLTIKETNIVFSQLVKSIGSLMQKVLKKQKNYIEMLSLRGICLILVQTSMQKPTKECGMIIIKSVLDLEVNGSKM